LCDLHGWSIWEPSCRRLTACPMDFPAHNAYSYNNPNGSRYSSNPDGSKYYDPGPNKIGRKWYESPDGMRHYLDDTPQHNDTQYPEYTEETYQAEAQYELDYDSSDTNPIYNEPGISNDMTDSVRPKQTARRGGAAYTGIPRTPSTPKAVKVKTEPGLPKLKTPKTQRPRKRLLHKHPQKPWRACP
jgi:hypothetical protein